MTMKLLTSRASLAVAAAALATLSLAACGSDPPTSATGSSSESGSTNASGLACPAGKLSAEGSSAQNDAITETIASYGAECGDKATIEYNPTGSGAGIKSFYNGLVDFAGSDSALKSEEVDGVVETEKAKERCQGNPAWNLPMVVGPIAFAYNVEGLDKLVLNAEVLSEIFNGTITTWNDDKIAKLNSGAIAAGRQDHRLLPLRRVGHHRERHQVPRRRRQRRVEGRAGQGLDGHRRGQEQVLRRGRGRHHHQELHLLHGVELRQDQQPQDGPDRQRQRGGRADRRVGRQGGR